MKKKWWKEAVAYQIYPRSFMDSNGDGIGDIQGIISKLDYLKELGIDVIWICPIYSSPNEDNGYDISDYKGISADFGTMADFDQLLAEVHCRGMKLIMDLVINHTSDQHPWFIEARTSTDNPYRDYYIWRAGKNGKEPNNWESIFGGSVWEYDKKTNEYFFHVFSRKQPDLNWENPMVRNELYEIIIWWLEKGIDGFRVDAISHIKKRHGLPNLPNPKKKKYVPSFAGHMNQKGINLFLEELKRETFAKFDIITIGEANGVKADEAKDWVDEESGYFNMIFQFEHLDLWGKNKDTGLDIVALKDTFTRWQTKLDGVGWNALFLENHDQPRSVSTWGNSSNYREESAQAFATMYFCMQGTPFIYQGQEIGMTNIIFPLIEDYNDVVVKNYYYHEIAKGKAHKDIMEKVQKISRDHSRTPMQWNNGKNAGFTLGTPWLKVNRNYLEINVEKSLQDQRSIYHYYKKLIQLRKENEIFVYGRYELILADHEKVYAYTRTLNNQIILIITNLFAEETSVVIPNSLNKKSRQLLISNYEVQSNKNIVTINLKPYEARVYLLK